MSDSVTLWTVAHQAPLSTGFPRQERRSGLLHPFFQGIFLTPGIALMSPALAGGFFTTESPGKPIRLGEWGKIETSSSQLTLPSTAPRPGAVRSEDREVHLQMIFISHASLAGVEVLEARLGVRFLLAAPLQVWIHLEEGKEMPFWLLQAKPQKLIQRSPGGCWMMWRVQLPLWDRKRVRSGRVQWLGPPQKA